MHQQWLADTAARELGMTAAGAATVETRYRYNPDVKSLLAMVPAVIPMLLLHDPGDADRALRGAREGARLDHQPLRHAGHAHSSSCSASSCPTSCSAMVNFLLLTLLAVTVFGVPVKGSFLALTAAALLFVTSAPPGRALALVLHAQPDRGDLRAP